MQPAFAAVLRKWDAMERESPYPSTSERKEQAGGTPTFAIAVKDGPLGVDLRELHRELGSKQRFSDWAKIKLAQFIEGKDFVINHSVMINSGRGRPAIDYAVSIDCAKHIAMMEQTERGRQVRRYFIECEKALRAASAPEVPAIPRTYIEALRAHLASEEKVLEQAKLLEAQRPAVEFYERFCDADGLASIRKTALSLRVPERQFVDWCLTHGILYRASTGFQSVGAGQLLPYAKWTKEDTGYLRLVPKLDKSGKERSQTLSPQAWHGPGGRGERLRYRAVELGSWMCGADAPASSASSVLPRPWWGGLGR